MIPLVILPQKLFVHSGLVIIAVHKSLGNNLHQVGISLIIFRQKHQMIIPVLSACHLTVKPGIGGHIDLAAE